MPIPGGLEPPRLIRLLRPCGTRHAVSLFHSDCPSRPPRQKSSRPLLRSHHDDRRFQHTRSRVDSSIPIVCPLCAEGPGCTLGLLARRSLRVSHIEIKVRVFPRRHRSILPFEQLACRPVATFITLPGRGVPNPAPCPDSPTSPPSPTFLISTEMVAPAGLEPARVQPHRAAPSCRRTPTLTERNGTIQPPATCVPRSSGSFRGEKCHISQRPRSTDAVLDRPKTYISRPDTRLPPFRDSDLLRTALLLRTDAQGIASKAAQVFRFPSRGAVQGRHQGIAPDKKKDKGYERDLRKRCAWP